MTCCCRRPENTHYATIKASEVCEGDYLDTTNDPDIARRDQGIDYIFADAEVRDGTATLHRTGKTVVQCRANRKVNVWRGARKFAEPRPIDLRDDRPFRNLSQVHRAGACGLSAAFPVGSVWEVGPFCEGYEPLVVRVTGAPHTSGVNYSKAPQDAEALDQPCWFIPTETVYSPHTKKPGAREGQPPHVLCALTPDMARKVGACCTPCCPPFHAEHCSRAYPSPLECEAQRLRCAVAHLEGQLASAHHAEDAMRADRDKWKSRADRMAANNATLQGKLSRAREALR